MKKSLIALCVVALMIMGVQSALATSYSFGDDRNFWPGWSNTSGNDNNSDTIGRPDLLGGEVVVDDDTGMITSLDIYYDPDPSIPFSMAPGDVFIDIVGLGGAQTWDYVLDLDQTLSLDTQPNGDILRVDVPLGDRTDIITPATGPKYTNDYELSNKYYSNTNTYRQDHPVALQDTVSSANVGDFVISHNALTGVISFTLNPGIKVGWNDFYIGFGPICANDVIYEMIDPIPEPSTVLLIGLGLIGLVAVGRKRVKK